jgi:hypothetical protein
VGPRPFERGELFYGREQEATSLVDSLLSSRVVLLHSPSGAGKTSLVQAAVAPDMERRGFQICARRDPFSLARVSTPPPEAAMNDNRYVASVVTALLSHVPGLDRTRDYSIAEALALLATEAGAPDQQLLILDQFEEILTLDPTDYAGQKYFFRQLGEALGDQDRWALVAMREDFMGGLDRFLRYVPGQLRTTFRLDLLDKVAARSAIREPADRWGVHFAKDAADRLIEDLQRVRTGALDGEATRTGAYVEPVFVEVVCDSLWRRVHEKPSPVTRITTDDLQAFGPLDAALTIYYNNVMREASSGRKAVERQIRDWIEIRLLTDDGMRRQTQSLPDVPNADEVMKVLQARYLIRSDPRPNAVWWELSHDRMGDPILSDNKTWRVDHLEGWQHAAHEWQRSRYNERLLLKGDLLKAARRYKRRNNSLTDEEREFLARSERAAASQGKLDRATARTNWLLVMLIISVTVNIVAGVVLLFR